MHERKAKVEAKKEAEDSCRNPRQQWLWPALGRWQWKWVFCVGGSRPPGGVDVKDRVVKDDFQVADCNNEPMKVPLYQDGEDQRPANCQRNTQHPFSAFALD